MAKKVKKGARLNREVRGDRRESDREYENREITEDRELNDRERLTEFRQSLFQSVLPDLPRIPGYHVIWLTTTNSADPIPARVRLGYEPIQAHEVPGWESTSLKTGEYAGCIGINEMIAFKLPLHLYEMYMREVHDTQPRQEEEKLSSVVDVIREAAAEGATRGAKGIKIEVEPGHEELDTDIRPPPRFAALTGER